MPWTSARKYLRTCGWCFACWKTKGRCWKRDDLGESEGGGYHVKGEGGRGSVEGGEGGGEGGRSLWQRLPDSQRSD